MRRQESMENRTISMNAIEASVFRLSLVLKQVKIPG
jgi:hypothetical protein